MSLFPNLEWTTLSHQVRPEKKAGSRSRSRDTHQGLSEASENEIGFAFCAAMPRRREEGFFFYERMDACVMLFRSDYVFANNGVESKERSLRSEKKFRKVSLREFISL